MNKVTRQCPQTTTFLKRMEIRSGLNRGPSAYQPNALPLCATPAGLDLYIYKPCLWALTECSPLDFRRSSSWKMWHFERFDHCSSLVTYQDLSVWSSGKNLETTDTKWALKTWVLMEDYCLQALGTFSVAVTKSFDYPLYVSLCLVIYEATLV